MEKKTIIAVILAVLLAILGFLGYKFITGED